MIDATTNNRKSTCGASHAPMRRRPGETTSSPSVPSLQRRATWKTMMKMNKLKYDVYYPPSVWCPVAFISPLRLPASISPPHTVRPMRPTYDYLPPNSCLRLETHFKSSRRTSPRSGDYGVRHSRESGMSKWRAKTCGTTHSCFDHAKSLTREHETRCPAPLPLPLLFPPLCQAHPCARLFPFTRVPRCHNRTSFLKSISTPCYPLSPLQRFFREYFL